MKERRELEGTGYHYADGNDDCLLVSRWAVRPDDLTGQSLPVSKLLPRGVRCDGNNGRGGGYVNASRGAQPPVTFRFKIIVEIEKD